MNAEQASEEQFLLKKEGPRKKKLILSVLLMSNLCAWCSTSLVAPFFPLEAAKKDLNETVIGLIVSCSEFVIFLVCPIIGTLVSKSDPRFYYITGLLIFGCCDEMFAFLNYSPPGGLYIAMCFAVRMLQAVGTSSIMTAGFALAAGTSPERTGSVYGMLETVSGSGYVVGPILGGLLNQYWGYSVPFWVFGSCVFVFGCVSWWVIPSQNRLKAKSSGVSAVTLFKSPLVWFGTNCMIVCQLGFSVWTPVFSQHLQQFNLNQTVIGVIFAVSSASFSLGAPIWGCLFDKNVPTVPLLIGGISLAAVNMLFFGPAPFLTFLPTVEWLTIMTSMFIGIFLVPVKIGSLKCIIHGARDLGIKNDGTIFGLAGGITMSSGCLGGFLGPVIGGALTEQVGFGWAMAISSLFLLQPVICFSPLLLSRCAKRSKSYAVVDHNLHV